MPAPGFDPVRSRADSAPAQLSPYYPQFSRIVPVPHNAGSVAWLGTVVPFDSASNIALIYSALKGDHVVNVQAGKLRHSGRDRPLLPDERLAYLVNMNTEFSLVALEFSGGRHPEVYCVEPEISRQRFPFHPHLRDDRSMLWKGRYIQALCTDYAPDLVCRSIVNLLDFATIFLAKHLVWLRTRRLIDRALGRVVVGPKPGDKILDLEGLHRGSDYNIHSSPLRNSFPYPFSERFGWEGFWPGSVARHDHAANLMLSDDSVCHCGSGNRYGSCHKRLDVEGESSAAIYVNRILGIERAA